MPGSPRALLDRIGVRHPIIQAPMAGVSTPEMAAAVTNAGGLGSIAVGATDADGARDMIAAVRALTGGPFNVNLFCHRPATVRPADEAAWIEHLRPWFEEFGAEPPSELREIYHSFVEDEAMLEMLLIARPAVVSFHFGLPPVDWIKALQSAGVVLLATATSLAEARVVAGAAIDAIVAQGWEAGGHRGMFDPDAPDERMGALTLTRLLVADLDVPVIAAGGIMDGGGIATALSHGAIAAQLGTAFVACDESLADTGYRAALMDTARSTVMTRVISGRPARCLANRFTAIDADGVPDYPIAYDLGKALNAAAKARGDYGFGAQWAGEGAPFSRPMPTGRLVETLVEELAPFSGGTRSAG